MASSVKILGQASYQGLVVDGVLQSLGPAASLLDRNYWYHMAPERAIQSALLLGLGGGSLARILYARHGQPRIIGVDDDPEVLQTATDAGWLNIPGLVVMEANAQAYVRTCRERFDYIAVDIYRGSKMPRWAYEKIFLRRVRNLLTPGGDIAINLFVTPELDAQMAKIRQVLEITQHIQTRGNVAVHARAKQSANLYSRPPGALL